MSTSIKVLIVDDSSIIRKIIVKSVSEGRFEIVGVAGNGLQALEMFKNFLPQIVTLDITMPEIDGLTVLGEMIKIKPDVKIVVISALSDKATGIRAIKMGAKSFIPKPFTTEDVQKTIIKLAETI